MITMHTRPRQIDGQKDRRAEEYHGTSAMIRSNECITRKKVWNFFQAPWSLDGRPNNIIIISVVCRWHRPSMRRCRRLTRIRQVVPLVTGRIQTSVWQSTTPTQCATVPNHSTTRSSSIWQERFGIQSVQFIQHRKARWFYRLLCWWSFGLYKCMCPVFTRTWLRYVRSLLSPICLTYVCRLSVCLFVHLTQGVKAFGNISSPLCTLAILWLLAKFYGDRLRGGGVKRKRGNKIEGLWNCRRLYLTNGTKYGLEYN